MVKINFSNEDMFIDAFVKGLRANPFSESVLREKVETMVEVRQRARSVPTSNQTYRSIDYD